MIEDSHNGIRAAYAAGMHPIMVPDLMEVTEEMKSLAEEILGSLCAVQEFFAGVRHINSFVFMSVSD